MQFHILVYLDKDVYYLHTLVVMEMELDRVWVVMDTVLVVSVV